MKFSQRMKQVIAALFGDKKTAKELTREEQDQVVAKYKEMFSSDMLEDYNKDKEQADKAVKYDEAFAALATTDPGTDPDKDPEEDPNKKPEENADLGAAIIDLKKKNEALETKSKDQEKKIGILSAKLEPDNPAQIKVDMKVFSRQHSKTHLFGIEHDFFSLDKRWNRLMVNPRQDELSGSDDKKMFVSFQRAVEDYGSSLAKRYQYLHSVGMLPGKPEKGAAFTQTTTQLADAGLGDQFVVLRQDALIEIGRAHV